MLDHQIQLCSFNPSYQRHISNDSTADIEFDFWSSHRTQFYDRDGSDAELEFEANLQEGFSGYSPPLWKPHESRSIEDEPSSPLLSRNHHFSSISPRSRMRAIGEGRKELMELIANLPESSYELSLKDIVEEQNMMKEVHEDIPEETSFHFETEAQLQKKKQQQQQMKSKSKSKKSSNSGRISRTGSMEKETFLIKMFFPSSLETKKIGKGKKRLKKAMEPSIEGSSKCINHNWIKRIFVGEESKINRRNSSSRSTSSSDSSTSRHDGCAHGNFLPGCWPFHRVKKSKNRRCTECIF